MKLDIEIINKFINNLEKDQNSRYKSYEHCRKCFLENRNNENERDLMTLNLFSYLASWGMLRNSFLMQKDYLFSKPIIDILCDDKYQYLLNYDYYKNDNPQYFAEMVIDLGNRIQSYYLEKQYYLEGETNPKKIENVTSTLKTKIIMGTLGCVPAYDQYFKNGLKKCGLNQTFNINSIIELLEVIKDNQELIKLMINKLGKTYTPMKILDMYFWKLGFEN